MHHMLIGKITLFCRLEAKDRVVFKAIESSDFKSRPDDFKNVSD